MSDLSIHGPVEPLITPHFTPKASPEAQGSQADPLVSLFQQNTALPQTSGKSFQATSLTHSSPLASLTCQVQQTQAKQLAGAASRQHSQQILGTPQKAPVTLASVYQAMQKDRQAQVDLLPS